MGLKYFFSGMALLICSLTMAQKKISLVPLGNLENKTQFIKGVEQHKATVLWFFSPDCPLCQQYTLELKKMQKQFGNAVQWYAIATGNPSIQQIKRFMSSYHFKMPALIDQHKQLSKFLKARITPEVFVFNSKYQLTYSGRIDNWAYAPGKTRAVTSIHDLNAQLNRLLKEQNIPYTTKTAIGCFIE